MATSQLERCKEGSWEFLLRRCTARQNPLPLTSPANSIDCRWAIEGGCRQQQNSSEWKRRTAPRPLPLPDLSDYGVLLFVYVGVSGTNLNAPLTQSTQVNQKAHHAEEDKQRQKKRPTRRNNYVMLLGSSLRRSAFLPDRSKHTHTATRTCTHTSAHSATRTSPTSHAEASFTTPGGEGPPPRRTYTNPNANTHTHTTWKTERHQTKPLRGERRGLKQHIN